jgi:hypothetical protein
MTEVTIEIRPMADLLESVPKDTHFFKVDTEGWELAVLKGCDWKKFRPRIIVMESVHPSSHQGLEHEWEPYLLAQGYEFVYFDGLNRFYIAHEQAQLRECFATPPNVFDSFRPFREVSLQREIDQLRTIASQAQSELHNIQRHLSERLSLHSELESEGLLPAVRDVRHLVAEGIDRICLMESELQELEKDARAARLWAARVAEQRVAEEIGRGPCFAGSYHKSQKSRM